MVLLSQMYWFTVHFPAERVTSTMFNRTQLTWPNSDVNFPAYLGIRGSAEVLRGANGYC